MSSSTRSTVSLIFFVSFIFSLALGSPSLSKPAIRQSTTVKTFGTLVLCSLQNGQPVVRYFEETNAKNLQIRTKGSGCSIEEVSGGGFKNHIVNWLTLSDRPSGETRDLVETDKTVINERQIVCGSSGQPLIRVKRSDNSKETLLKCDLGSQAHIVFFQIKQ